jgi:hypothetical protein
MYRRYPIGASIAPIKISFSAAELDCDQGGIWMKVSGVMWIIGAFFFLTPLAHADGAATMQFNGVNGANDGVYYVSPYTGTMNYGTPSAQSVVLFCDDINNEVSMGQVWSANVTSLATAATSGSFDNTRYGNPLVNSGLGSNPYASSAAMLYEKAAWLVTQFGSHPGDYVSLQYALWNLMSPKNTSAGSLAYMGSDGITVAQWLAMAGAGYTNIDLANFAIVTNVGPLGYTGQVQEFIVPTPEPATILLLVVGIGTMFLLVSRRQQQSL